MTTVTQLKKPSVSSGQDGAGESTTLTLDRILLSQANPRKSVDEDKINGLADSILTDGLLQNILVQPVEGKPDKFAVVSGELRIRALRKLADEGRISSDHPVPVVIRYDLDKDTTLRIATIGNVQRENLSPHESLYHIADLPNPQTAFMELEKQAQALLDILHLEGDEDQTVLYVLGDHRYDLYQAGPKKSDLVNALYKHFAVAKDQKDPDEKQQVINSWTPSIMAFPVVLEDHDE